MANLENKIIQYLSDYPEREFYGQEIADKIKCSKASASIILKSLMDKKIVSKNTKGHMNFYQVNTKSPDLKKFKINAAIDILKPILSKLEKKSRKIILFGSAGRGEQTADSDIDLFVLSRDKKEVLDIIKKNKLNIKAIIKTPGEWSEMEEREPEFYREIKSGIILHDYVSGI
jgi:predicted nucleotidyltransferase